MSEVNELIKGMSKAYGEGVVSLGVNYPATPRIPTGAFPFDLASGGGFPAGRISLVYGPESSLKTTLVLLAIANYQRLYPEKKCAFIDVESSYDPAWGTFLGVNNEALVYVLPDYAEQVVDIVEGLLYAEDIGIVAVDSLAALISQNEVVSSAEKVIVGGSALIVGRLYRKVTLALSKAKAEQRLPTFIAINQIRYKIGVIYGDKESLPGGVAFLFASSLTVRLYGKDEIDKKINAVLPAWKVCTGVIRKWKVPITARSFEFKLSLLKQGLYRIGEVDTWGTLSTYLKDQGYLYKGEKSGWLLFEEHYDTLSGLRTRLSLEPEFRDYTCQVVQDTAMGVYDGEEGADAIELSKVANTLSKGGD